MEAIREELNRSEAAWATRVENARREGELKGRNDVLAEVSHSGFYPGVGVSGYAQSSYPGGLGATPGPASWRPAAATNPGDVSVELQQKTLEAIRSLREDMRRSSYGEEGSPEYRRRPVRADGRNGVPSRPSPDQQQGVEQLTKQVQQLQDSIALLMSNGSVSRPPQVAEPLNEWLTQSIASAMSSRDGGGHSKAQGQAPRARASQLFRTPQKQEDSSRLLVSPPDAAEDNVFELSKLRRQLDLTPPSSGHAWAEPPAPPQPASASEDQTSMMRSSRRDMAPRPNGGAMYPRPNYWREKYG